MAFDTFRAPQTELLEDCVHCGFCLDTCPTYVLWGNEADSPRGRIVLIGEGLRTDEPMSDEMVTHFDRCLGCMACVTACPSGVRYDRLIERVRPQVERHHRRSLFERGLRRMLFGTLPHPRRLRTLAPLMIAGRKLGSDRIPGRVGELAKVAPQLSMRALRSTGFPEHVPAAGEQRGRVGVLLGCVQRVFYADVQRATIATLAAEGFEVFAPQMPECCGALEMHSGEEPAAVTRAEATIAAFNAIEGLDYVVTSAAGCGSAMKEYGELVGTPEAQRFAERVVDVDRAARIRGAPGAAGAGAAQGRLPRRVPPRPRPEGARAAAGDAANDSRARAAREPGGAGRLLRIGRRLQHAAARGRRRPRSAQGPQPARHRRRCDGSGQPGLRGAARPPLPRPGPPAADLSPRRARVALDQGQAPSRRTSPRSRARTWRRSAGA